MRRAVSLGISLMGILFAAASAHAAPFRTKGGTILRSNISQFAFLGGSLNLACNGSKVAKLSSKSLRIGAKFSLIRVNAEIRARKRTLRALAAREGARSTFANARIARARLERRELQAAKDTCLEQGAAGSCKRPPCGKKSSSSASSQESSLPDSSSSNSSSSSIESCATGSAIWNNSYIGRREGRFEVDFSGVPNGAALDALMALSPAAGSSFDDFAVLVRFNPAGFIDARDGAAYRADSALTYEAGKSYAFRLLIDTVNHLYDVYVTPSGASEAAVARNFAFRASQAAASHFDYFGIFSDQGSQQVCGVTVLGGESSSRSNSSESSSSSISSDALTPIARWDMVPYQRLSASAALNLGVVAFSKNGIDRVEFRISGQGYGGGTKITRAMTLNPQSNVYEYWVPLSAAEFLSDGPITVRASVYGKDGGLRDEFTGGGDLGLDPLTFIVSPSSALPQPEAFVAASGGSDGYGTEAIGDSNRRFATIGRAIEVITAYRNARGAGNNADGGVVRLLPGTHTVSMGSAHAVTENEWLTITNAPNAGGNASNTLINNVVENPWNPLGSKYLKISGITLQSPGANRMLIRPTANGQSVWFDRSNLIGADRYTSGHLDYPAGDFSNSYYTHDDISNVSFAMRGGQVRLARGLVIHHIGDDAFAKDPLVINSRAYDLDPGTTGWHTDCWQWYGTPVPHNAIIYNYQCSETHYQGIFARTQGMYEGEPINPPAEGVAIVNLSTNLLEPNYTAKNAWYIPVNHFVLWNSSFNQVFSFWNDRGPGGLIQPLNITDFSAVGNNFQSLTLNAPLGADNGGDPQAPGISLADWKHNHYVSHSDYFQETPGADASTGSAGTDSYNRPLAGSVLIDRISEPLVPADVNNKLRGSAADAGAFEY